MQVKAWDEDCWDRWLEKGRGCEHEGLIFDSTDAAESGQAGAVI